MSELPVAPLAGVPIDAGVAFGGRDGSARLRREEIAIAARFQRQGGWPYAAVALAGFALWLAALGLAPAGLMPLWAAFAISTVVCCYCYLLAHEAIHDNLFARGSRWHWLNELCGWLLLIPLVLPFSLARILHQRHHSHVNDPENDPDFIDNAPNLRAALWKTIVNRQPVGGWRESYRRCCERIGTPSAAGAMRTALFATLLYPVALAAMAWSGHALAAALVWWLPRHIALTYMRIYLSWMPHFPREGQEGRYRSTRVFHSRWGDLGSSYMGYHLVHHLYPRVPLHLTRPAYYALRPILMARGVDCSAKPGRD
jgi:beta-carotene hydroxylase